MDRARRKEILVGAEDFVEIRTGGYYYVDKTGLIRDLLQKKGKVTLFTRPRRFGKTLNMSMLKAFFEIGCSPQIFEGLEIARETELCEEYMGRFPVISISLKGIEADSYETARKLVARTINKEARRQRRLLDRAMLMPEEQELLASLQAGDMDDAALCSSLCDLSELLYEYYGQKPIILIDEYDVPLAKASEHGYYDQMLLLIRNLFSQALKTNDSLEFAVLTGCLRISKESIFTGLNNIVTYSVADVECSQYFGFTEGEVHALLGEYGLLAHEQEVKEWYDGYLFGNTGVYCPWDVLCHCKKLCADPKARPRDYWANTSGDGIIRHFLEMAGTATARDEMERLVSGEPAWKRVRQELTYRDLYSSIENLWGVLFATGYLTQQEYADSDTLPLVIPNMEIRSIFTSQVMELFQENARKDSASLGAFCQAFQDGDAEEIEQVLRQYLEQTIGLRDNAQREGLRESFYHGILLGLLSSRGDWIVTSNRESGEGYSDIQIKLKKEKMGIVIEVKYAGTGKLETKCQEALRQIAAKKYGQRLRQEGMQAILSYGIACRRDDCRVMLVKEESNT